MSSRDEAIAAAEPQRQAAIVSAQKAADNARRRELWAQEAEKQRILRQRAEALDIAATKLKELGLDPESVNISIGAQTPEEIRNVGYGGPTYYSKPATTTLTWILESLNFTGVVSHKVTKGVPATREWYFDSYYKPNMNDVSATARVEGRQIVRRIHDLADIGNLLGAKESQGDQSGSAGS